MENGVLWNKFMDYLDLLSKPSLKRLCRVVLENEKFWDWPASVELHHAYRGGLVEHTLEVLDFAVSTAKTVGANLDVVIPAAVWHDYMKIEDYREEKMKFVRAPYYHVIHHIAGGFAEFRKIAEKEFLDSVLTDAISHAILAHHGRKEQGSPVEPKTEEAWILHAADVWSAFYGGKR